MAQSIRIVAFVDGAEVELGWAQAKVFSTGSKGWNLSSKAEVAGTRCQVGLNLIVIGSKAQAAQAPKADPQAAYEAAQAKLQAAMAPSADEVQVAAGAVSAPFPAAGSQEACNALAGIPKAHGAARAARRAAAKATA